MRCQVKSDSVVTVVWDEQQGWKSEVADFRAGKGQTEQEMEGLVWVKVQDEAGDG
jgi:hypothetical protein